MIIFVFKVVAQVIMWIKTDLELGEWAIRITSPTSNFACTSPLRWALGKRKKDERKWVNL